MNVRVRYLDRDGRRRTTRSSAASPRAPSSTRSTTSTASCSSTASRPAHAQHLGAVRALRPRGLRAPGAPSWCSESASVTRATGASSPGSAASGPRPGWWSRSRATGSPPCDARRAPSRPPAPSGSTGSRCPGSPTRTRTPFTARSAGATQRGRGQLLDLARADVRGRRAPRPRELPRASPGRPSPRWRSPGITAVGEFHYLHHDPGGRAVREPQRDRRGDAWRPRARPASGSPCSTPATCTAVSASR